MDAEPIHDEATGFEHRLEVQVIEAFQLHMEREGRRGELAVTESDGLRRLFHGASVTQ
jgi:hypothetical protein